MFATCEEAKNLHPESTLSDWQRVLGKKGITINQFFNCQRFHDPDGDTNHLGFSAEVLHLAYDLVIMT